MTKLLTNSRHAAIHSPMQNSGTHYRSLLKQELEKRIAKNPAFSLRSFSKKVGIDPGQLSRILNAKQNLSVQMASLIAHQIFSQTRERDYFVTLVELSQKKNIKIRDRLLEKIDRLQPKGQVINLGLESMRMLTGWYYIALLELVETQKFSDNPNTLAGLLGITPTQAKTAFDTLITLQLIRKEGNQWKKTHRKLATPTNVPSAELRNFHQQMIQKSAESLESQPLENRYVVGKTFAFHKKNMSKVQTIIENFRDELSQYLLSSADLADSVYQLNVQFFELTQTFKNKKELK